MEAKELRIGNWVNIYDDYTSQVTGLTENGKVWCVKRPTDEKCAWNQVNPIPLTEEWLRRLGLNVRQREADECTWLEFDFPVVEELVQSSDGTYFFDCDSDTLRIMYVHQLQNLYFSLTGEELTIKERVEG